MIVMGHTLLRFHLWKRRTFQPELDWRVRMLAEFDEETR